MRDQQLINLGNHLTLIAINFQKRSFEKLKRSFISNKKSHPASEPIERSLGGSDDALVTCLHQTLFDQ